MNRTPIAELPSRVGERVTIRGWADPEETADLIRASIERAKTAL